MPTTPDTRVPLDAIVAALDTELRTAEIPDYPGAVNGLQVANRAPITRVAVAVDASRLAIAAAADAGANLLVVDHGLFWGGVQPLVGMAYTRLSLLLGHDIAVYASHLPLDLHPDLGNNTRLARALELEPTSPFAMFKGIGIGVAGTATLPTAELAQRLGHVTARHGGTVRSTVPLAGRQTHRWAICTGSGASSDTLREARERGIDTLIVGEGPHHTTVEAIEHDLCVLHAGHYATETLGVQAVGEWLNTRFGLPWTFLPLPTGS